MFEVNDDGRESEYYGYTYIDPFVDFLNTFGFDVAQGGKGSSSIKIDGIDFHINDKSCSYMSKSAFSRIRSVRKPANRFILLTKSYSGKDYILKVHFNKEYDGVVIRKKIQDAIDEHNNVEKLIADRQETDRINTIAVANHYLSQPGIKNNVHSIGISEGKISFDIRTAHTTITIKNTGFFEGVSMWKMEAGESELKEMLKTLADLPSKIESIVSSIAAAGPVSEDLQQWAIKAYSKSFDVVKMEYWKH